MNLKHEPASVPQDGAGKIAALEEQLKSEKAKHAAVEARLAETTAQVTTSTPHVEIAG